MEWLEENEYYLVCDMFLFGIDFKLIDFTIM